MLLTNTGGALGEALERLRATDAVRRSVGTLKALDDAIEAGFNASRPSLNGQTKEVQALMDLRDRFYGESAGRQEPGREFYLVPDQFPTAEVLRERPDEYMDAVFPKPVVVQQLRLEKGC